MSYFPSLLSEFNRTVMGLTKRCTSLESSLKAAREEADCLREQLRQSEAMNRLQGVSSAVKNNVFDRPPNSWHGELSKVSSR